MWEEICKLIAKIVEFFYTPVQDWGMAIIILTVIFRILIMPLMLSQTKSSFNMQKVQPKLKEIQNKYRNDPVRMQEETRKLYAESKFNPVAGCVPMLIQMPIFIALFQVLRNIQDFLPQYNSFTFYNIVPNLLSSPSEAFEKGFGAFIPYLVLIVIFVGATFLPMFLQQRLNQDAQQRKQMMIMSGLMGVMMIFISWGSPAGVLLFWGVSGIIATITQQVYMRHLRNNQVDSGNEVIDVQPVNVEVERKIKKKKPTKKS